MPSHALPRRLSSSRFPRRGSRTAGSRTSSRSPSDEERWTEQVNVICGWERKKAKALNRAFRRVTTPASFQLVFESAIRIGDESLGIFARLHPPLAYRREAREIATLVRREQAGLKSALDAFKHGNRADFARAIRRAIAADERSSRLLVELGATDCGPRSQTIPEQPRARIV